MINRGQGAVVLTNSDSGEQLALEIMTSVANAYQWPIMRSCTSKALTKEEILRYSGVYQAEKGSTVTISENANGLFIFPASPKKEISLFKIGENQFVLADTADYLAISFDQEAGVIKRMTLTQNFGEITKLKKVK